MAWGKAGSTTLTGTGDTLTTTGMTASETNQFLFHTLASGNADTRYKYNGTDQMALRYNQNGGSDATSTSDTPPQQIWVAYGDHFNVNYMANVSGEEKLVITFDITASATGAGTTPQRMESVHKSVQSDQITEINISNGAAGDYLTDSNLTVLGSDITPAAAVPAISNIQDNSLFVEKENARRYWFDGTTWTMQPTLEDDFSSSAGWTQVTNTASGVSGGELIGLTNSSGTNGAGAWKDYGLVDDEKFVLRCKFQIVTQSGETGNASTLYFGISDTNGATSPFSNRDGFGIAITNYALSGMLWLYPDGTTWDNADTDMSLTPTATTYYLEIARTSATSVTFKLFSDEYSTVVKTHTQTIASTLNGLRYVMFQEWRNGSSNTTKVAVDNLQIFNGVGTVN